MTSAFLNKTIFLMNLWNLKCSWANKNPKKELLHISQSSRTWLSVETTTAAICIYYLEFCMDLSLLSHLIAQFFLISLYGLIDIYIWGYTLLDLVARIVPGVATGPSFNWIPCPSSEYSLALE